MRNTISPHDIVRASVIVCTRDRPLELEACLASLRKLDYPRVEIIVVHNDREDPRVKSISERSGARYVSEPARGLSRARNRGAREAAGDIVAYIDDDALAEPGWLTALVREFSDECVMAVTGRTLPIRLETSAERTYAAWGGYTIGDGRPRVLDRSDPRWFQLACFGGIGNGMNMAFRRSVFELWSGFDERLGRGVPIVGGEEHYAFFNLVDRGFRVAYTPEAIVRHPFPATLDELRYESARQLSSTLAYILFLFVEQPRYRRRLARFVWGRAFKAGRRTREEGRLWSLGGWARLRAYLVGVRLFIKSRREPLADGPSELV